MKQRIKRLTDNSLEHSGFEKKIEKPAGAFPTTEYSPKKLSEVKYRLLCISKINIESTSVIVLRVAMTVLLLIAALYLYDFTVSGNPDNAALDASKSISNEVLLAIFSLLIAFAGLLAYIFHHLIKDSLHKEIKTMAYDERLASKTEMQLTSSNVFCKLYEITKKIKNGDEAVAKIPVLSVPGHTEIFIKKQAHDPCRVYEAFENNNFLYKAIMHDILATQLMRKINNKNEYIDLSLKVLNNRSYNICLKYELWKTLTDRLEDKAIEELVKEYKAKDIDIEVDDEEIRLALKARQKLQEAITNEIFYSYKDVTLYHIKSWKNTCKAIDKLIEDSPRWEKIQNKIHKYDD
jgi:hypothetical protein